MLVRKVVRDDTIRRLRLKNPTVRVQSFNRPNLKYEIKPKKGNVIDEVWCGNGRETIVAPQSFFVFYFLLLSLVVASQSEHVDATTT